MYKDGERVIIFGSELHGCHGIIINPTGQASSAYTVAIDGDGIHPDTHVIEQRYLVRHAEYEASMAAVQDNSLNTVLPADPQERKAIPIGSGVLDYFPSALVEIAKLSKAGNDQHNPGEPLHWAREKSADHADTIIRHWIDRGLYDADGQRHSAKLAWRALALLQMELEAAGAPKARGAR